MRRLHVVLLSILISLTGIAVPLIAQADSYGPGSLVREVPVAGTPHVLDGRVLSVVQVGNTIILGGTFTQTRNNSSDTVIATEPAGRLRRDHQGDQHHLQPEPERRGQRRTAHG